VNSHWARCSKVVPIASRTDSPESKHTALIAVNTGPGSRGSLHPPFEPSRHGAGLEGDVVKRALAIPGATSSQDNGRQNRQKPGRQCPCRPPTGAAGNQKTVGAQLNGWPPLNPGATAAGQRVEAESCGVRWRGSNRLAWIKSCKRGNKWVNPWRAGINQRPEGGEVSCLHRTGQFPSGTGFRRN